MQRDLHGIGRLGKGGDFSTGAAMDWTVYLKHRQVKLRQQVLYDLYYPPAIPYQQTTDAAGELELRRQILAQDNPLAAALANGQFLHHWLPVPNRKSRA